LSKYDKMTHDDFDRILRDIVDQNPASYLLDVAGVYEIASEEYNNEVLERWEEEQDEDEDKSET